MTLCPITLPAPGSRIGRVCGPGEFPSDDAGIVLCHVEGRFGSWAEVLMDSGKTERCSGLNRSPGIGWHLITRAA